MIDRATVERIMEAANIVDVVSEFVTLRKSGANYKGLCPFHDEDAERGETRWVSSWNTNR